MSAPDGASPTPVAPTAPAGSPGASWWPGPPPPSRGAALAELAAQPTAAAEARFRERLRASGGVVVEPAGVGEVDVTFGWPVEAGAQCVVVLDTITDTHRPDVSPMMLQRVPGTGLLAGTFRLPADLRVTCGWWAGDDLDVCAGRDREGWRAVLARCAPSPWNTDVVANAHGGAGSVLALPEALPQPWYGRRDDVTPGHVSAGVVSSRSLGRDVRCEVHVPAGARGPFALAVLLDGFMWTQIQPFAPCLDNLHAERVIRPTVTVFVDSGDGELRFAELGLAGELPEFLADELVPWVAGQVELGTDPGARVVAGQSLGGLAAAHVVLTRPDVFGAAVVQSGSFWWPDERPGELTRRYASSSVTSVRLFHEVGRFENQLLDVNREFRDVARRSGADVTYREVAGGHDYASWRGGLADGVVHLLRA